MDREAIFRKLSADIDVAAARRVAASKRFDDATKGRDKGDIGQATAEYTSALQGVSVAVQRLNNFLLYGVVPDDLQTRSPETKE